MVIIRGIRLIATTRLIIHRITGIITEVRGITEMDTMMVITVVIVMIITAITIRIRTERMAIEVLRTIIVERVLRRMEIGVRRILRTNRRTRQQIDRARIVQL